VVPRVWKICEPLSCHTCKNIKFKTKYKTSSVELYTAT